MAAPAEVSEKCSNFQIRQFKELKIYIAANMTLNKMVYLLLTLGAHAQQGLLTLGAHAHSEGYSSCRVCMCVCVYVCVYV